MTISSSNPFKTLARWGMDASGLSHWRYRYDEWKASRTGEAPPAVDEDGVAIPSPYLMYLIGQTTNWRFFLKNGEEALGAFAAAVERNGGDFRGAGRVLDLGCGCGRLARHLPKMTDAEIFGVDYNPRLVKWCRENLKGRFARNRLNPPLDFPPAHFDVVYLLSVFTHLKLETQNAWLAELARVVTPGGFALVTFHDEDHGGLDKVGLDADKLAAAGFHVHNQSSEGSNHLAAFQSRAYVREQMSGQFDVVEIVRSDENPLTQAIAVLRKPL